MVEARPASGEGIPSSVNTPKPKKPKRTKSYGDDRRTPSSTTSSTTSSGGIGTSTPVDPGIGKSLGVKSVPHISNPTKSARDTDDGVDIIGSIVKDAKKDLRLMRQTQHGADTSLNVTDKDSFSDFLTSVPPVGLKNDLNAQVGTVPAPKPKPTWLQSHPLIAEQARVAIASGDMVALANVLDTKFQSENDRLTRRLKRRGEMFKNYLADAEIAVEQGDLDYTEDNPLNPKWLKTPKIEGINSAQDQRQLRHDILAQHPEAKDALDEFFYGVNFSKFDKGMVGNSEYRQQQIEFYRAELETTQSYYDRAFKKASAAEDIYDNWSKEDEDKQDAEKKDILESVDTSLVHKYTVEFDDEGNPINPSFTDKKQVKEEIRNRVRLGLLNPEDLLSLLGNTDVLVSPDLKFTPEQQKSYDAQMRKVADAAAEDERLKEVAGGTPGTSGTPGNLPMTAMWNETNDIIGGALKQIGVGIGGGGVDTIMFAMDKLTRPLFGVNAMRKEWYAMDKDDHSNRGSIEKHTLALANQQILSGANWTDSLDDLSASGVKNVLKSGWGGFSSGGWTGNSEDPVWGSDVIKFNAERDGVENIYDKGWFQTVSGLTTDLVVDPTMYIGIGPVKYSLKAADRLAHLGQDVNKTNETTQAVVKALQGSDQELNSEKVRLLLNGNWTSRPASPQQKLQHMADVEQGVRHIQERMQKAVIQKGNQVPAEMAQLEYYGKIYRDRYAKVVGDHEDDTLRATLDATFGEDFVDHAMATRELSPHIQGLHTNLKFNDDVARELGFYSAADTSRLTTAVRKYGSYPKLAAHRKTLQGAELEAFDASLEKARMKLIAEGASPGKSVGEVFGPKFGRNLTEAEEGSLYKTIRDAKKVTATTRVETANGPKYIKHPEVERLEALDYQIRRQEPKLKNASQATAVGEKTKYNRLVEARDRQRKVVNNIQAEQVVNLLSVPETVDYRNLAKARSMLEKELERRANVEDKFVSTSRDVSQPSKNIKSKTNVHERSSDSILERPDSILKSDKSFHMDKLLEPDAEHFNSMRDQIEHYIGVANRQIADLESRGVTTNTKIANLVDTMPEGFKTPEGSFNWDAFMHSYKTKNVPEHGFVTFDINIRQFHTGGRNIPDPGIEHWINEAVEALNQQYHSIWKPIQAAGAARSSETLTDLANSAWAKVHPEANNNNLVKLNEMFDGAEHGAPVVPDPETGVILKIGSNDNQKRFTQLASSADKELNVRGLKWLEEAHGKSTTVNLRAPSVSDTTIRNADVVKDLTGATVSVGTPSTLAPEALISELRAAGRSLPKDRLEATKWIIKNKNSVKLDLEIHNIAARRIFHNTHGRSIASARNLRKTVFTEAASKARDKFIHDFKIMKKEELEKYKDYEAKATLAKEATMAKFDEGVRQGNVGFHPFDRSISFAKKADDTLGAVKTNLAHKNLAERTAIKDAIAASEDPAEVARLRQALSETIEEWKKQKISLNEVRAEARLSAEALKDRLGEEAILRAATADLATMNKQFQLGVLGTNIPIPGSQALFKATEKISGLAGIKGSRNIWSKAFKPPSKQLDDADLNYVRAQQVGNIPNIIEHHAKQLTEWFGKFDRDERIKVMGMIRGGDLKAAQAANPKLTEAITVSLKNIVDDIGMEIGNHTYGALDLNRRLPKGINLQSKTPIKSVEDLLAAVKREDISELVGKGGRRNERKAVKAIRTMTDPWALAWELNIASETAKGDVAMFHFLNTKFGRERGYKDINFSGKTIRKKSKNWEPGHETIEKLHDDYGWKTLEKIPEAHRTHLFPPEAAEKIDILLDMLSPQNVGKTGDFIQRALRVPDMATSGWKAAVTMYNPGYYTRNGVGEIMSSAMFGVHSVKPYVKSDKVIAYVTNRDKPIQALLHANPAAKQLEIGDKTGKGTDVLLQMKNGRKVTLDDAWIGFNAEGLKTGFFNTEFSKQGRKPLFGENPVGRGARKTHQEMRTVGENYEDWLRLAHYIDVIEKHPGTFEEASREAARMVRKAHFDYTDFTPFEKAVMMRVFPFYKWTRKSMPMMATLMFTRPGKMTAFPKTMNYVSNELSNQDISEDPNGVAPNFTGIAPTWVQQLWGYQIAEEHGNATTAFRLATPQMDALQSLSSPGNTAYTLGNPLIKAPAEIAAGSTFGDNLGAGFDVPTRDDNEDWIKTLLRTTPQGSAASKAIGEDAAGNPNEISSNDALSFMTGLGFYDTYLGKGKPPEESLEDTLGNGLTSSDSVDTITEVPAVGSSFLKKILGGDYRPQGS